MAKKSANPADAYRKALKARELKKNKDARKSARDTQTVKRDTREIENEIKGLKSQGKLDAPAKSRLEALEKELKYVTTAKENYVKAHPEARDKIFKQHNGPSRDGDEHGESGPSDLNGLYGPDGKLRDPTRSVYYDPVYNPYGVPPPGMPYRERTPEESEDEDEEDDGSDDDIVMPDGRPPGEDSDSDDSDDIPLPEGPPPGSAPPPPLPSFIPTRPSSFARPPPPPKSNASWGWGDELASVPQPVPISSSNPRPPRPPPSHPSLPSRPPTSHVSTPTGPRAAHDLPSRPTPPTSAVISSEPTKVADTASSSGKAPDYSAAAISAAPVMRDLRKEATAFVPRGVKRKQTAAPGGLSVNAAPGGGVIDEDGDMRRVKQKEEGGGLMGRLQGVLGTAPSRGDSKGEADDEYQKFLEGLGDIA